MMLPFLVTALVLAQTPASSNAEAELQTGIALTKSGRFQEAIPHFLQARGRVHETFAAGFNLALCYVGVGDYPKAIAALLALQNGNHADEVHNLLAQAYIGNREPEKGFVVFKRAAAAAPRDEKLYVFVADACLRQGYNALGLQVLGIGLQNLPNAPRLLYRRALCESRLEEIGPAGRDFDRVQQLAPDSDLGYIAGVQGKFLEGKIPEAVDLARQGIRRGKQDPVLLAALGEGLLRLGAVPGHSEWTEVQSVLERAVTEQPDYSSAQIAIGKMYLLENRTDAAILHLEAGRRLDPDNAAVYPALAAAYRKAGDPKKERAVLLALQELNREQALRIASGAGGHAGVAGSVY